MKTKQQNVLAIGENGAEVYDQVNGVHKKTIRGMLDRDRHGYALLGVFISGGRNDFAIFNAKNGIGIYVLLAKMFGLSNMVHVGVILIIFKSKPGNELYSF